MGRPEKVIAAGPRLGLPGPRPGSLQGPGIQGRSAQEKFGLPLGDYPDLKSVKVELTRKLLGMGPKEKINA